MLLKPYNRFDYRNQVKQNNIKQKAQQNNPQTVSPSTIAFKRVTPEHFFINIEDYGKNIKWGKFAAKLANGNKKNVLSEDSTVRNEIYVIGKKYNSFARSNITTSYPESFGTLKTESDMDLYCSINIFSRYWRFAERIHNKLSNDKNELLNRKISAQNHQMYQVQNQIDGKDIVLTQFNADIDNGGLFFIHPPYGTADILLDKSEKTLERLKNYKDKKLNQKEINDAYKKIGSIHWCLAQGMPFMRGSATVADIYTKSLFESLNIQTTPWKKGIAPDWEAFLTPHDEYCEKYQSFFEEKKPDKIHKMINFIRNKIKPRVEPTEP